MSKTQFWKPELSNINENAIIGEDCIIHSHAVIYDDVKIGDRCKIQAFAFIPNKITIKNDVFIGPRVTFTNDKNPPSNHQGWLQTIVEDKASIGAGAIILPGIRIGRGAIVGAGAVVTKSVDAYKTVAGNPAREKKY